MDPFKAQGFLETDSPRFGRLDEATILYKENPLLIDCLRPDALQVARKRVGDWVSKIGRQSSSADGGPIMELYLVRLARRANQPSSLQISDRIDERRMRPWFCDTLCLLECDDVGSRLFYHAEAIQLQLTNDRCLPRAGRSRQYEPFI